MTFVLSSVTNGVGHLTLARPDRINALTHEMVHELADTLAAWRSDPEVVSVLFDGEGERGFSAGGDIRELQQLVIAGELGKVRDFFRDEYRLNAMIAHYPKPVVAIMDGITMGGGVGLGGHASVRVVTERSRVALPEVRIGFTPDVGGSWLLSRAPGNTGIHLALTGRSMDATDALYSGFADVFVPAANIPHLMQALTERADPASTSEIALLFDETPQGGTGGAGSTRASRTAGPVPELFADLIPGAIPGAGWQVGPRLLASPSAQVGSGSRSLAESRNWIDACYSAPTVADIVHRLRLWNGEKAEDAASAADDIEKWSPSALVATLESVRRARRLVTLEDALEQEYRVACWLIERPDFVEGIWGRVVDKTRPTVWNPATLIDIPRVVAHVVLTDNRWGSVFS